MIFFFVKLCDYFETTIEYFIMFNTSQQACEILSTYSIFTWCQMSDLI